VADVKRIVQTDFIAKDEKFSGAMKSMSESASGLGSTLTGTMGIVGMLTGALAGLGLGAAIKGIVSIQSKFEDTKIAMAGFLSALGVSTDFAAGMRDAAQAQKDITMAAAKLPGEAEDYIRVFKAGLPEVQGAIGGTVKDMYTFTNQLTAITSTLGLSSEQVARDIKLMLRAGQASVGAHVKTWTQLLPFINKVPGMADLTAKKFGAMSEQARAAILKQTLFGKELGQMIDAAGSSWSAQWGAAVSNSKELVRMMTGPLFEGMKGALGYVNAMFFDGEGNATTLTSLLTAAGEIVSENLVSGFKVAFEWAKKLGAEVGSMLDVIGKSPAIARLGDLASNMGKGIGNALQGPDNGGDSAASGGGLAAFGPLIGGLIDAFSRPGVMDSIFGSLISTMNIATRVMGPFVEAMGAAQVLIGDLLAPVLMALFDALNQILSPVADLFVGLFMIAGFVLDRLHPAMQLFGMAIGNLITAIAEYLHPILRLLGAGITWVYRKIAEQLTPAINLLIQAFTWVFNFVAKWLRKEGKQMNDFADDILGKEEKDGGGGDLFGGILAALKGRWFADKAAENAAKAASRAAPASRGKVVQDFRGSKFDITQKFAEGFDPDRIAVAFAQDLGRMGEQKLQSGFEPVFGIR
jgi:hypothetical protein